MSNMTLYYSLIFHICLTGFRCRETHTGKERGLNDIFEKQKIKTSIKCCVAVMGIFLNIYRLRRDAH